MGNTLGTNNEVVVAESGNPGEIVKATMQDIYHVLMAIRKEGIPAKHGMDEYRLSEHYLRNRTIGGEFEYNVHNDGQWVIDKIKQHKPEPTKAPDHFVVEM